MRMRNNLICFFLLITVTSKSFAQQENLSKEDITIINSQIKETIDNFLRFLSIASSHSFNINSENDKKRVERISKYFSRSAIIEISNKNTSAVIKKGYYEYLTKILPGYANRYALVDIKAIAIDNNVMQQLKPDYINGNIAGYYGVIRYRQTFKAYGFSKIITPKGDIPYLYDIKPDYSDSTVKQATIYITRTETSGGTVWNIRINGVKVLQTY